MALGVLVAVLDLIPVIGSTIGGILVTLVALSVSTAVAIASLMFYVVYRLVEDYLLVPRVMDRAVDVPPVLTIVALIIGGSLLGHRRGLPRHPGRGHRAAADDPRGLAAARPGLIAGAGEAGIRGSRRRGRRALPGAARGVHRAAQGPAGPGEGRRRQGAGQGHRRAAQAVGRRLGVQPAGARAPGRDRGARRARRPAPRGAGEPGRRRAQGARHPAPPAGRGADPAGPLAGLRAGPSDQQPVATQVEETLRAAMADPEAGEALLTGRLTSPMSYSGMGTTAPAGPDLRLVRHPKVRAGAETRGRRRPGAAGRRGRRASPGAGAGGGRARRAEEERRRRELDEARRPPRRRAAVADEAPAPPRGAPAAGRRARRPAAGAAGAGDGAGRRAGRGRARGGGGGGGAQAGGASPGGRRARGGGRRRGPGPGAWPTWPSSSGATADRRLPGAGAGRHSGTSPDDPAGRGGPP